MSNINSTYRKAFEDNCFELLIYAYQKVMEERIFQLNWLENDISYELYEKRYICHLNFVFQKRSKK